MKGYMKGLRDRLEAEGQGPHELQVNGGSLLCTRHGARALAVDAPGLEKNPFFTADGPDGKLTGGDRLWVSPEVAWFWPSLEDARERPLETARTPAAIDPGAYQVVEAVDEGGTRLTWRQVVSDLTDVRSGQVLRRLEIERTFASSAAPTRLGDDVACISFTITHTLRGLDADPGVAVGAWNLLQVPPTGTLICPTTHRADVRSYYDPFGERHVAVDHHAVRFLIDGRRRIKMGLTPEATTGRMGYYRPTTAGNATLIVRIFGPLPGEPYADLPRDDRRHDLHGTIQQLAPPLDGDALQAYNDDGSAFGGSTGGDPTFGEMEHHDPCLVAGFGPMGLPTTRTATSVTHILAGPDAAVRDAGQHLLGVAIVPI